MSLQLPPELQSAMQPFLVRGRYADETELLCDSLAALKRERDDDLAAIFRGIEDEQAGRLIPARDLLAKARAVKSSSVAFE